MKRKRRYTDEFRAGCVVMLEAANYETEQTRALTIVSKSQNVPESTLRSWWNRLHQNGKLPERGVTPANLYDEKKFDLRAALKRELAEIFNSVDGVRLDANYRDLIWAAAVLVDKNQLLDNKPTAIVKLQQALEEGTITPDEVRQKWPALAEKYDHING